ncbi:hypothetical protein AcW1_001986 [Taiwanofungus camphoratus]|nr:hypothetical protein AcW1_001986 [Antrodia cinnamomea]
MSFDALRCEALDKSHSRQPESVHKLRFLDPSRGGKIRFYWAIQMDACEASSIRGVSRLVLSFTEMTGGGSRARPQEHSDYPPHKESIVHSYSSSVKYVSQEVDNILRFGGWLWNIIG